TASNLLVLVVGDAGELPASVLAGLTAAGALVARFSSSAAAAEWLAKVPGPARLLDAGALEIDRALRVARREGRPLGLTAQAFDLLLALAEAPGRSPTLRER